MQIMFGTQNWLSVRVELQCDQIVILADIVVKKAALLIVCVTVKESSVPTLVRRWLNLNLTKS
jgi:hypothetical protein